MKRTTWLVCLLLVLFVLWLTACGQEPETITVEVTRIVEVEVHAVETVEVTRVVEMVIEVPVTPAPSNAQLAAETFAEDSGLGEQAFEVLAGTHPTLTFLLVEVGIPTVEPIVTTDDGTAPAGAQAYCTPNGGWGEFIMRFDDLQTSIVKHMTEPELEGWILLEGEFTRSNSDETIQGTGWIYGNYVYENFGTSWVPQLNDAPVAADAIAELPGCELAVSTQGMDTWEHAVNLWDNTPESGTLACETRSRYPVGTDTYVSVVCTSDAQRPVSFQFQNQGPKEINQIIVGDTTSYELVWVFSPEVPGVATGLMLAFDADGHLVVQFPKLSPYEYWIARDVEDE